MDEGLTGEMTESGRTGLTRPDKLARLAGVWGVALAWLIVDMVSKAWALRTLYAGERALIPGVLWLNLVRNPGAAFGLFPRGQVFFVAMTLLLVGVGIWAPLVMTGKRFTIGHVGLGLLVGGGVGNLFDRVFRAGLVVDFIDFRFWPVFNLADTGIVVGTGLVLIYLLVTILRSDATPR